MILQKWLNDKLKECAKELSGRVPNKPNSFHYSFHCGYYTGYERAMLDLENQIENGAEIYRSKCKCGDKYYDEGQICL